VKETNEFPFWSSSYIIQETIRRIPVDFWRSVLVHLSF